MQVIAINGSPRKNWNTAILLEHALQGAASQGAATELFHLYELQFKGCISCFACKLKNGKSYGRCALRDDLTPLLQKLEQADAVIFGSPLYFSDVTGAMRSCIERMAFPYLVYDANYSSLFPKKIQLGFIYTMNVNEGRAAEMGYEQLFARTEMPLQRCFGPLQSLRCYDTYQFADYARYVASAFNEADKAEQRRRQFPEDCRQAVALGERLVSY
ncbi:MAG: flavodoxin family protein [Sporomusaceae bacterium]|nr:flavodoxin family protein [Sporomusaceae bacterium]